MKKILLFGMLTFTAMGLYSNPLPDPEFYINEFMITGTNHWTIEIYLNYCWLGQFDSITIQSASGIARVINYQGNTVPCFTDQDLSGLLTINPNGDILTLVGYRWSMGNLSSTLSFGNVVNPAVPAPITGQSIERFGSSNCITPQVEIYSISSHPTLGSVNDTTGTCGTIHGIVYDLAGHPVADQLFYMDFPFATDANGHFTTRIFSRIFSWDTICYEKWSGHFSTVKIFPIAYTMKPDSVISGDLHLLSTLLVSIPPQPEKNASGLNIFPNPVTNMITVSYSTDLSAKNGDLYLEIYDVNGKKVLVKSLESHLGVVRIPIDLVNGMYLAILKSKRNTIGSTRFIVNTAE